MTISALGVGSGLDLTGLLGDLKKAEQQRLIPLIQQQESYQSKISAYGSVRGAVSNFQDALKKLGDAEFFGSTSSEVKGEALLVAAGTGAAVGSYAIEVEQMASAYSIATRRVDDKASPLGAGTMSFTLASGHSFDVSVEADKSSLEDIRNAINAADEGVRASIVNDGQGYRLVLASAQTGEDAAISNINFGGLSGELVTDTATEMAASNARLTINNIAVESQSNQVEGALEGVTLSLVEEGSASLEVSVDTDTIKEAVSDFVTAYNDLQSRMRRLTGYNESTEQGGVLQGNSTARIMQNAFRSAMSSGGESGLLSDLGISFQLDGSLQLDEEKFNTAIAEDPSKVAGFFAGVEGDEGFVSRVDAVVEDFVKTDGRLDVATKGLETSMDRLDERYLRMERSIEATIARYQKQFVQLDSMIASMNATSSYLTQQFDMMSAQFAAKK